MSTSTIVELVLADDTADRAEVMAVAGFLAGYCGHTRTSYATDLRLFGGWCHQAKLTLFAVRRAHLELFGRWMEENGRMRSTVARRQTPFLLRAAQSRCAARAPAGRPERHEGARL